MNRFAEQINRMAGQMPLPKLGQHQLDSIEEGRVFAKEFIEAAHAGDLPADGLMLATTLVGKMGKGYDLILRGFLQELQKALAKP